MRSLLHFCLLVTISFVTLDAYAIAEIPGYVGSQSFYLNDDQQLSHLIRSSEQKKVELTRYQQEQNQMGDELLDLENQKQKLVEKSHLIQNDREKSVNERISLLERLVALQEDPEINKQAILDTQAEIQKLDTLISESLKLLNSIQSEISSLEKRIDHVRNEYNKAVVGTDDARQRYQISFDLAQEYKEKLIIEAQKINKEGARAGQSDGRMDAADLQSSGELYGPNYKPKIYHSKPIMIKAFADGYNFNYRLYSRLEY